MRAENRFGPGPPCVSKPLLAKDPFGKVSLASRIFLFIINVGLCIITACELEFYVIPGN